MKQLLMRCRHLCLVLVALFSVFSIHGEEYMEIMKTGRTFVYRNRFRNNMFILSDIMSDNIIKNGIRYVAGDTVIAGLTCKIVNSSGYPGNYKPYNLYYYENDGKLYDVNIDQDSKTPVFSLMIDMNLEIGDLLETEDEYKGCKVVDIDYIPINGHNLKRIFFSSGDRRPDRFGDEMCWIEGIGMIRPANGIGPAAISEKSSIEMIVDEDGLFATLDDLYQGISFNGKAISWSKMTRDDRVWIYGGRDEQGQWYKSYCRFGPLEMHGLFWYRPFYEFRRDIWNDSSDYDSAIITDGGNIPEALLRESVGSVYMMNEDSDVVPTENSLYYFAHDLQFYYLSGYTLKFTSDMKNYSIWCPPSIEDNENAWYDTVEIDGKKRIRYGWSLSEDCNPSFIEGIGITENGFLPYFFDPTAFKSPDAPRLLEYCDAEMNTLHRFVTMEDVYASYAAEIGDDGIGDEDTMYDLYGRIITDVQPNQVYIQKGKVRINR